ncbi:MAG TPA: hypothetical protein PKD09_00745 [Aggregatilinea sp.]|uniref:hypothetical protein n=1 Tax=Aggregatilinea sp. TaxID=2806333 RepID=UPI002BFFC0DA|nr:hypothetical protein [Aggregatilinea sp.]HML20143.1 hypothetical protein [Aggregatilinea sp.]
MGGIGRLLSLPFRLVGRLIGVLLRPFVGPVSRRLDRSPALGRLIGRASSSMATQRGLLLMIGVGLLLLSLVMHGVVLVIMVLAGGFGAGLYWLCIPFALFHVAVLVSFVGIMLATPLGQGYSDRV